MLSSLKNYLLFVLLFVLPICTISGPGTGQQGHLPGYSDLGDEGEPLCNIGDGRRLRNSHAYAPKAVSVAHVVMHHQEKSVHRFKACYPMAANFVSFITAFKREDQPDAFFVLLKLAVDGAVLGPELIASGNFILIKNSYHLNRSD